MNENLDLTKILKDCPEGTMLYSPIFGNVYFDRINPVLNTIFIYFYTDGIKNYEYFTRDGRYDKRTNGECLLFPSKDNRDWSTFRIPNKLPKTWEEFCENHPIKESEYYIDKFSNIDSFVGGTFKRDSIYDKNVLPNEHYAEAVLALCQLIQLRDCYNDGWVPNWKDPFETKYCIYYSDDEINCNTVCSYQEVLSFKTPELRDEFLKNFRDLIEVAKPLI